MKNSRKIGRFDLQPGNWITIDGQIFKVINRSDWSFDVCRCFLMDGDGQILDYCPRMSTLGFTKNVFSSSIMLQDVDEIKRDFGEEKFSFLQGKALEHLKRLAGSDDFDLGFDPLSDSAKPLGASSILRLLGDKSVDTFLLQYKQAGTASVACKAETPEPDSNLNHSATSKPL